MKNFISRSQGYLSADVDAELIVSAEAAASGV
jgi:hypothetical protein